MNIVQGQGLPDFVMMDDKSVSEDGFMSNLALRFAQKQIYTYIGEQVVAMNPFQKMPELYSTTNLKEYNKKYMYEVQPHIYSLADDTFRQLMKDKRDQCVIVTGESGAGKTEGAKIFMQYISAISTTSKGSAEDIKEKLLDSNPVLEAFGNAKTVRNDNSSRFGKYMEIQFDELGSPLGGKISQYLLEKSRVVTRAEHERSFHIFYLLLTQKNLLGPLSLKSEASEYMYLKHSKCFTVDGMDDAAEFKIVDKAMTHLGFSPNDKQSVWKVLAAALHLGNVTFEAGTKVQNADSSQLKDTSFIPLIAGLLAVNDTALERALTSRSITTGVAKRRASNITVPLTIKQAASSRDSLAKALYNAVFDLVVATINTSIVNTSKHKSAAVVGVLDIYGFEIFEQNSFEQFCINYCNEKLQQLFINLVLKAEQEEYKREGIEWKEIDYFDNSPIVDLIEGTPTGIYKLLDEVCAVGEPTSQDFITKLDQAFSKKHKHYDSYSSSKDKTIGATSFRIHHYAGKVDYEGEQFIFKNRDTLYEDLVLMIARSSDKLVAGFFPTAIADSQDTDQRKKRPMTAGTQFVKNVNSLIASLRQCQPHYIRCIKSNDKKKAFDLDEQRVRHQVRYLNLVETVRVRKAGFCSRQVYDRFLARYKMVAPATWPKWKGSDKDGVGHIMSHLKVDPNEFRMGTTKLFIRNANTLYLLEEQRAKWMPMVVTKMQKVVRGHKGRDKANKLKLSTYIQKLYRGWKARTSFEHYRATVIIQKVWRGHAMRRYVKTHRAKILKERDDARRLKAATKIQKFVRKLIIRRYLGKLIKAYAAKPKDWGKSLAFPATATATTKAMDPVLKRLARKYWGHMKIKSVKKEELPFIRQKIVTMSFFHGRKPWTPQRPFTADYMDIPANPARPAYEQAVKTMFQKHGDSAIAFSDSVHKVNRHGKSQEQVIIITDKHIYKYKPKNYTMIKSGTPLQNVREVVLSPNNDPWVVIKMDPQSGQRDMILDLGSHGVERYSELTTVLYHQLESLFNIHITVSFKTEIQYNNSRTFKEQGKDMVVNFAKDPNPKPGVTSHYQPGKGNSGTVFYV